MSHPFPYDGAMNDPENDNIFPGQTARWQYDLAVRGLEDGISQARKRLLDRSGISRNPLTFEMSMRLIKEWVHDLGETWQSVSNTLDSGFERLVEMSRPEEVKQFCSELSRLLLRAAAIENELVATEFHPRCRSIRWAADGLTEHNLRRMEECMENVQRLLENPEAGGNYEFTLVLNVDGLGRFRVEPLEAAMPEEWCAPAEPASPSGEEVEYRFGFMAKLLCFCIAFCIVSMLPPAWFFALFCLCLLPWALTDRRRG